MQPPQPTQFDVEPSVPEQPNDSPARGFDPWAEGVAEVVDALERLRIGAAFALLGVLCCAGSIVVGLLLLVPTVIATPFAVLAPCRRAGLRLDAGKRYVVTVIELLLIIGVVCAIWSIPMVITSVVAGLTPTLVTAWVLAWFALVVASWMAVMECLARLCRVVALSPRLARWWRVLLLGYAFTLVPMIALVTGHIGDRFFEWIGAVFLLGFVLSLATLAVSDRTHAAAKSLRGTFARAVAQSNSPPESM